MHLIARDTSIFVLGSHCKICEGQICIGSGCSIFQASVISLMFHTHFLQSLRCLKGLALNLVCAFNYQNNIP
jgi:hypothetical protein